MEFACNPVDVDVGSQVRDIREREGYALDYIAAMLKISPISYERLEAGEARFEATQLRALSRLMRVNVAVFFARLACLANDATAPMHNTSVTRARQRVHSERFDFADLVSNRRSSNENSRSRR